MINNYAITVVSVVVVFCYVMSIATARIMIGVKLVENGHSSGSLGGSPSLGSSP